MMVGVRVADVSYFFDLPEPVMMTDVRSVSSYQNIWFKLPDVSSYTELYRFYFY